MQRSPECFLLLLSFLSLLSAVTSIQDDSEGPVIRPNIHVDDLYLPEFFSISRSIVGRADGSVSEDLQNNVPASSNTIEPGNSKFYQFLSKSLHGPKSAQNPNPLDVIGRQQEPEHQELKKRADDVTYYLTLNTCRQPTSNSQSDPPAQLLLFISYINPNPDGTQRNSHVPPVTDGFGSFSDPTSGDIFIKVEAPSTSQYTGSYNFELVISIDGYYSNFVENSTMYFIDSDKQAAIFVSGNLTAVDADGSVDTNAVAAWNNNGPRYTLQAVKQNDNQFHGLMKSSCALRNTTRLGSSTQNQTELRVETGLTTTAGPALQQQFYLSGLEAGTSYFASMSLPSSDKAIGSGKLGGGGIIYNKVAFTTKSVGNCRIIYNQTSCPQINYAVPFNPTLSNISAQGDFTSWYNGQFDSNYQFFNYSLQQVACDTSPDSQYSLAVTCEDCRNAYTDWLCAVLNPRCHDFSSPLPYLQPRAIGYPFPAGTQGSLGSDPIFSSPSRDRVAFNSSRNPAIDSSIQPGPYKELLPCGDLCHSLVRSCPAIMGFACPYNPQGYNFSYGYPLMDGLNPECNDPRAVFGVSSGRIIRPAFVMLLMGLFILSIAIG